ncbi:S8 family serine peptidase [Mechercharimyces sp. CAU 1602]|uniref:S8 family serine peptidase n=1 Tax=Mechercharimyces sp. CAU 1602 TaxID=2973933 RepID=UPI0021619C03|nr:S8 family serine peptidase [Mechercharimyces sp. CAU 1602]MCS1352545.1 S8 family serine peptidase [Mechercharimyces sp. CAU 1602]
MKRMRKGFAVVLALALTCTMSFALVLSAEAKDQSSLMEEGRKHIIVKFKDNVSIQAMGSMHKKEGSKMLSRNDRLRYDVVEVHGQSVEDAIADYEKRADVEYAEPRIVYHTMWTPDDPYYASDQYGPQNMSAEGAWDITRGNSDVVVAVVDTGVQDDHQDLSQQVSQGYDFVDDDRNAYDEQGHGTHVAGTIAATTNNGKGVAGVAPDVSIMAVRVLDSNGSGYNDWVASGIEYAASNGADVINLSLGGSRSSQVVKDAVEFAWAQGAVVIAAAGNSNTSSPSYPAYYEESIAVAAVDSGDRKASFSNYGDWVDIAAPGVDIISTQLGGGYVKYSGTSMAAPHTAGAAALLASSGMNHTEIRAALENNADHIPGTGTSWQNGRVNILAALDGDGDDGGGEEDDPYEPNDSLADAYGPINSDQKYKSYIYDGSDEDYYKLKTSRSGTITVKLRSLPADYDLYLYDADGNMLDRSWNGGTSRETISYNGGAGTYYVKVVGWNGASSKTDTYRLKAIFNQ